MKDGFNPETLTLPPELAGRQWLTFEEFAKPIGVSANTVYNWYKAGIIRARKFTPRHIRIPVEEFERLKRGELMEGKDG